MLHMRTSMRSLIPYCVTALNSTLRHLQTEFRPMIL